MALTQATRTVLEQSTSEYQTTLQDENGTAIVLATIDTATLTLYNHSDGAIINSRDGQDVKNANNVTIHATSGLLTWAIQPADNIIVALIDHLGSTKTTSQFGWLEKHVAEFRIIWSTTKESPHELVLLVKNLRKTM